MARPLRIQDPGYYHVTSRGNDGADIFIDVGDRQLFISLLNRIARDSDWSLHAWCLMTNHFHLVVENRQANLSAGMHRLNGVYARWFNERHERTGHLFGRRFWAKPIAGEPQLYNTAEYVFDNPVRAGLCRSRPEWPWLGGLFWRHAAAARSGARPILRRVRPCPVPGTGHVRCQAPDRSPRGYLGFGKAG